MPMRGIDISNWQTGIDLSKINIDFMLCKATEGVGFVDKQCDNFITQAKNKGIPWGFYHFARENSAASEAQAFYDACKGYIGKGIPVLDYEVWGKNSNDITWCEAFISKFHELSGIWCMIYISASHCKDFAGSWIPDRCGLWVAGYPRNYTDWTNDSIPYNITPWNICAIWQFTSALRLTGYNGNLDGDFAYMDANAWAKYAGTSGTSNDTPVSTPPMPDYEQLATEVINGKWGNGEARKKALNDKYGLGTYDKVQKIVNTRLSAPNYEQLATEVINGKWGNGWNRMNALNSAYGVDTYEKVQEIVNRRLM